MTEEEAVEAIKRHVEAVEAIAAWSGMQEASLRAYPGECCSVEYVKDGREKKLVLVGAAVWERVL